MSHSIEENQMEVTIGSYQQLVSAMSQDYRTGVNDQSSGDRIIAMVKNNTCCVVMLCF